LTGFRNLLKYQIS